MKNISRSCRKITNAQQKTQQEDASHRCVFLFLNAF